MSSPRFPATATLLNAKVCPLDKFDALFAKITQERQISDGYFLQEHSDEVGLLFVVNGTPYAAARLAGDAYSFSEIHEFFAAYSHQPRSPLSFFVADKRLLLGLMVLFRYRPSLHYTTDLVSLEEILAKVAARGADSILGIHFGVEWAITICTKGKPTTNYLPSPGGQMSKELTSAEQLLDYTHARTSGGVTVDVYEQTRVGPAGDAMLVTPETRGRLTEVFLRVAAKVEEEAVAHAEHQIPAVVAEPAVSADAEEPFIATTQRVGVLDVPPPMPAQEEVVPAPAPEPAAPPVIKGPYPEVLLFLGERQLGTFSLGKGELTIGRNPGNDILIDNVGVSRRHAVVKWSGDRAVVEDLGSANGTLVNGQKITSHELHHGDEILVLKHRLVYHAPRGAMAPAFEVARDAVHETIYIEPAAIAQAAAGRPEAATPRLRPRLILPDLKKLLLEGEEISLGSGPDCQIQLSGMFVARVHARIIPERDGQFKIVHIAGLAGTRVNGEKISEHVLRHGDEIAIGKQKLLFRLER